MGRSALSIWNWASNGPPGAWQFRQDGRGPRKLRPSIAMRPPIPWQLNRRMADGKGFSDFENYAVETGDDSFGLEFRRKVAVGHFTTATVVG